MAINNKLEILYEDASIIVCNKPAGVSSQVERGFDPDMISLLSNYLSQNVTASLSEAPYVGVVHRLDKPVSGVMVYAKTKKAAAALSKELAENSFCKHYYAIVILGDNFDQITNGEITLTDYLLHDVKSNSSSVVNEGCPNAKKAVLKYNTVKTFTIEDAVGKPVNLALLDIQLLTGRHHQIRVQLSHAGFPILGDKKYGTDVNLTFKLKKTGLTLCAYNLSFTHPDTKEHMNFSIEPKYGIWTTLF